jgi:perosamine synthetase
VVVPMARPILGSEERIGIHQVLDSGILSKGAKGQALEEEWAAFCGTSHAVAVNTGTAALIASLACLGVGKGDEVITVAFTFNATVAAILAVGATPVLVDVDPDTFLMDLGCLSAALSVETAAVIPVHLLGLMVDPNLLYDAVSPRGCFIVEDAAQAHGAEVAGWRAGSIGDLGAFSLYATKNMTAGEGGLITTKDQALRDWLLTYRNHGSHQTYLHESLGYNYRLPEVSAAIALGQLHRLDRMNSERRQLAATYDAELASLEGVVTPFVPQGRLHVYHQYAIKVDPTRRDCVRRGMAERGVSTAVHYGIPIHLQPYYRRLGLKVPALPVTERLAGEVLSLPIFPGLSETEQAQVIDALKAALVGKAT